VPAEFVDRMYRDYQRLRSVAKVARLYGRTRQAMWEIFHRRKVQMRVKVFQSKVVWQGVAYTMHGGYLSATAGDRRPLHHVIWEASHGAIPPGYNVRFIDGDRQHCVLDNLECLPLAEISRRTATGENQHTKARQARRIQELEPILRSLAFAAAQRNARFSLDVEDLVQVGRIAVRDADRTFDPDKTPSFRGFAIQRVRWAISAWIKQHARNVRVPTAKFYAGWINEVSIHAPVGEDEDGSTFEEVFLGEDQTVTASAESGDRSGVIARLLKRMPRRDAAIIRSRFFQAKTLQQVADELGVTGEAVRQAEKRILARLRRSRCLALFRKEAA
jgi:RNA polymerase sigma factor (sigma-70 family)